MSVPRITQNEHEAIEQLQKAGRTHRQIERILGLTHGLLSKPYRVGDDARPIIDRQFGGAWVYPAKPEGED